MNVYLKFVTIVENQENEPIKRIELGIEFPEKINRKHQIEDHLSKNKFRVDVKVTQQKHEK